MGRSRSRITIANMLAITGLLVMQTVDQALASVVLPSGAGTLTIGPQAMEGNLQIRPGDTIKAGYDFTMPGAHAAAQVTVENASITMAVTCSNGTTPPAITFALPVQTYSDPVGSPSWYPSGDQSSPAVYQGSVTAPDLCSGGVMSGAEGATFKATIFSTDTNDKVNFRFHYSDNTSGSWSATITAPLTPTAKTVLTATLTPSLGLTLAVDHSSAIPGDTLTYSGTVTNIGATLTLTGDFTASASGSSTATVMSYWDNVATSLDSTTWTALAGTSAAQSGYTPAVAPPISSGTTLTSTPVATNGVTYPASGDPLLGTTITSGSSALWHYTASVPLTPSQVNTLLDPTKVKAIRNSFHLEVFPANPSVTQPSIVNVDFSGIFFAASPAPSGAVTNVTVNVQPPTGATVTINSGTVPGLALLVSGGSATYSTTYKVPVPAAKGTREGDAAYLSRLTGIEGSSLSASASASGGSSAGPISVAAPAVSTTEHLPILGIVKTGPASRDAGSGVSYQLALTNSGGATATSLTVTDTLSDGGSGTVSNVSVSLAPAATSMATASYTIPAATQPGTLSDTAAVTWNDTNNNAYGPVSGSAATRVTTNGVPAEIQPATSTSIQANFFAEPATAQTFVAVKTDTPAFSQNFPTINFNPPAGTVPHNISGVGPQTRPFTDVTTDLVGNFAGTIPAQGGIYQAGIGPLQSFDAALQANFIVQAAGDVTFVIYHDDGFILAIGNAATRVSGVYVGPPTASAFAGYPVIGAFNQMVAGPRTDEVTVHFPAAGIYPYELDYFEAGADSLTLTLTTAPAPSGSTGMTVGGVFVTGHDPDFHAVQGPNQAGAQHIIQRAIAAVTRAKANPSVLLVMDVRDPGSGSSDPRSGMTASGFTTFDVADYGSGTTGVLDLRTVRFANYDVVVVASDFGGWLRQAELDDLNGRAADIATYLGQGGGLVAFAESGSSGLTVTGRFGFLPCLNAISAGGSESGFQLTSIGQAIGLVPTDVNGNFYHNVFSSPCGMDVVDLDTAGRPVSLTSTGVSRSWNIAHDFQLAPNQANPSNGAVWSYLQGSNPLDPSSYSKLPSFTSQAYSIAGLQQWTGSFASGGRSDDLLPAAGVNVSGASQHPLTFVWPNGVFRVHPWTPAVVVAWTSPFTGTVHVEGAVTHLDQVCGDGVRWNVLSGSTRLASGQVTFGALAGQFLSEGTGGASLNQISVTTGQSLYFVVDAGAQGNFSCDSTALDVTVVEGAALITRPLPPATTLLIQPASVGATVGQGVNLTVAAMDGMGAPVPGVPVLVSVSGPNSQSLQVTTDAGGLARISYVSAAAGVDLVTATANMAGRLTVSNTTTVNWTVPGPNPNLAPPAISAPTPADGTIVTKPVPVTATIAPPAGQTIASWSVAYQAQSQGTLVTIASGTGSPPATLATFDPTLRPNGTYAIIVSAIASGGGTQTVTTSVAVLGTLKPGRFVATYQDLSVPVNGFQMAVRRTYDSIDKGVGDFGTGWRVDLANFRVSANRQLGAGGWTLYPTQCIFGLCFYAFKTSTPHYVTVTFPDGHLEIFDFTPKGGAGLLYWQGTAAFAARAGTGVTSTLDVAGDPGLSYDFAGNIVDSSGYYNPTRFKLTTRDGRILILDTAVGLVSESDQSGNSLTVDASGIHSTIGPASSQTSGPSITISRDSQGRITDITGPITGQHYHYAYFPAVNELQAVTNPMGNTLSYTYDPQSGNLQKSLDPNNQPLQSLIYDANGRLVSVANGSQPATTINTNLGAQQQTVVDPNGKLSTVLTSDDLGDVIERDDVFGGKTLKSTYTYDAVGRPTSATGPLGNTSAIHYDQSTGNVLTVSSSGRTWGLENYNDFGEPGLIRKPDGTIQMTLTYDTKTGALVAEQQPGANPTIFTYSAAGQLKSVADPGGRSMSYSYDANSNLATIADSQGRTVKVSIDSGGQVHTVTDQIGNQTTFDHNPDGSLKAVTDALQHQWQYTYDSLGNVSNVTDPLKNATSFLYNDLGELQQKTDRNGQITTYGYDVDGVLTKITRPGNDIVNFGYDPIGRLIETDNAQSHVDRSYDELSRPIAETTCANTGSPSTSCSPSPTGNQPTITLNYSYLPDSQLKTLSSSDPAIPAVQYGYDVLGRLTSMQDGSQAPFTFGYDPLGRLSSLARPNGIVDSFGYNASGDLVSRDANLANTTVARFDYGVDPVTGRRSSATDNNGSSTYTYYDNGTLRSATHPVGSGIPNESYSYDAAGNRSATGVSSTYDAADRIQSDGTFAFTFDAEGNMKTKTPLAGGSGTSYSWNADHQLLGITYPNGTSSSFRYDPFGRRVGATNNGQDTRFIYNGLRVHADYNGSNQLQASYVSGLEALSAGGLPSYYLSDGLGSVRGVTDASGTVTGTSNYDSFGVPAANNGSSPNRETFTGYQYDSTSGLYDAGARYYDASTGRFLSEDPLSSINPYPYAANDPVNSVDQNGLQAVGEYSILLQTDANNAQCIAGEVAAIAGPAIAGAAFGLAGEPVSSDEVISTITVALVINGAVCVAAAATTNPCSFRIVGWKNYPTWAARPTGWMRPINGAEYAASDAAKRAANAGIRRGAGGQLGDSQIHEWQPTKFNGSPTDLSNKAALPPGLHSELTTWWYGLQLYLRARGCP